MYPMKEIIFKFSCFLTILMWSMCWENMDINISLPSLCLNMDRKTKNQIGKVFCLELFNELNSCHFKISGKTATFHLY